MTNSSMKTITWNMRRAKKGSSAWSYFNELNPDIALLQEVTSYPESLSNTYSILFCKAFTKDGTEQSFGTAIFIKGGSLEVIPFLAKEAWVNNELTRLQGNILPVTITLPNGKNINIVNVYSPAWPIDRKRLAGINLDYLKSELTKDIWAIDLVQAVLRNQDLEETDWILGGDLNSSVTFDTKFPVGLRNNQEILDRLKQNYGLVECLHFKQGKLTPTFKSNKTKKVVDQIDHIFVKESMLPRVRTCIIGDQERVFGASLSDHLPIILDLEI